MSRSLIRMPVITTLVTAALALSASHANAQILSYDGFGNGPLADLAGSAGGTGWTGAWADGGTDPTTIQGAGLSYSGLATLPGGAVTPTAGGVWPSSIYGRGFTAPPAGTTKLYVSFLMRDDAAYGIWGGVSFGTYPYAMYVGSPQGYYSYGLMMSQGLGDVTNKPLVQGETTLVVVRITKNSPSGVNYSMYLNPTIGGAEPSFPAATFTLGPVNSLPTSIRIDNGTGFTTDEIRIGTTWASVLPAAPNPWTDLGFAKPGVAGAPKLAGSGPLTANSTNSITLTNAKPNSVATLIIGANVLNVPFMGGVLVPEPTIVVALNTNAAGSVALQSTWPAGIGAGIPFRFQYWIQDPAATLGLSASNGLQGMSQ